MSGEAVIEYLHSQTLNRYIDKRKKSGKLIQSDFYLPHYLYSLVPLSRWFRENRKYVIAGYTPTINYDELITVENIATINYQVQSFMDHYYGKNRNSVVNNASNKLNVTKFDSKLYKDISINGSLHVITEIVVKYQIKHDLSNINLLADDSFHMGNELVQEIEATLLSKGLLQRPKIYLDDVPSNIIDELKRIVTSHGGAIVLQPNDATHIINWDEGHDNNINVESSEEFIRPLDLRLEYHGGVALVHWWYHPDSYDEWIPSSDVDFSEPPDVMPLQDPSKPWEICCRYVFDCAIFNEWGNEIDYMRENSTTGNDEDEVEEVVDTTTTAIARVASGGRRNRNNKKKKIIENTNANTSSTNAASLINDIPVIEGVYATDRMMAHFAPPLYDVTCKRKHYFLDITANSKGIGDIQFCEGINNEGVIEIVQDVIDPAAASAVPPPTAGSSKKKAKHSVDVSQLVRTPPSWFKIDAISTIEKLFLNDYIFYGKTNPSVDAVARDYLLIRNYIMDLSNSNPVVYLSFLDCRRKISGDASVILKIHEFLDAFQLINYQVKLEHRPLLSSYRPPSTYDMKLILNAQLAGVNPSGDAIISKPLSDPSPSSDQSKWTVDCVNKLQELVVKHGLEWESIATAMIRYTNDPFYTDTECLKQFVCVPITSRPMFSSSYYEELLAPAAIASLLHGTLSQKLILFYQIINKKMKNTCKKDEIDTIINHVKQAQLPVHQPRKDPEYEERIHTISQAVTTIGKRLELLKKVDKSIEMERVRINYDLAEIYRLKVDTMVTNYMEQ